MEQEDNNIETAWACKACGYESESGEKVLSLNMGDAFQALVCPNCMTIQLPPPIYEEFKRMMETNIVRAK